MKLNEVIAYTMDFCSYLFDKEPALMDNIKTIILFGSGARGELEKDSDIDLFFETKERDEDLEEKIEALKEDFYTSSKYKNYWELIYGSDYPLSIKTGDIKSWSSLYPALILEGKVIYGNFSSGNYEGQRKILFSWENVKGKNRINLHRNLFGYNYNDKKYPGLMEKYNGYRLSKGSILVPIEAREDFREVFKKFKIPLIEKVIIEI